MFAFLPQSRTRKKKAMQLFEALRAQSRLAVFYEQYHVPDTVDGRFEMLAMHNYLMMRRLTAAGEIKLSQKLFDVFFRNIEKNLREMGIGDLGVPKHMKRMMQGFNGRSKNYEDALNEDDHDALVEAVKRNIYGTIEEPDERAASDMADYIKASAAIDGFDAVFADPAVIEEREHA